MPATFRIYLPLQSYFVLDSSHLETLLIFLGFVSNTKPCSLSPSFHHQVICFDFFLFTSSFPLLVQKRLLIIQEAGTLYQFVRGSGFGTKAPVGLYPKTKASFSFLAPSLIFLTSFPSPLLLFSSSHFSIIYWYKMPPAFVGFSHNLQFSIRDLNLVRAKGSDHYCTLCTHTPCARCLASFPSSERRMK
jgi:hypothetical protein